MVVERVLRIKMDITSQRNSTELISYDFMHLHIATGFISATGVLANGFVLFVLYRYGKLQYTSCTVLMLHQTVTDMASSVSIAVAGTLYVLYSGQLEGSWGEVVCRMFISEAIFRTTFLASSFSLVCITIERYFIVVYPIFHRNHFTRQVVVWMIIADWVLAFILALPLAVYNHVVNGRCTAFWLSNKLAAAYKSINLIFIFLIPLVIVV